MWRLTMSDGDTLVPANPDESARAAAIAAMGRRLATAGLRTRQCLIDLQLAQADAYRVRPDSACDFTARQLPAACEPDLDSIPWSGYFAAIRRFGFLGSAAACGFGLVLLGESLPKGPAYHEARSGADAVQEAELQTAAQASSPATPQQKQQVGQQQSPPAPPAGALPKPANLPDPQERKPIVLAASLGNDTATNTASASNSANTGAAAALVNASSVGVAPHTPARIETVIAAAVTSAPAPLPHPQVQPALPASRMVTASAPDVAKANAADAGAGYKAPVHTETVAATAVTSAPAPLAHPQVRPVLPPSRVVTASASDVANANTADARAASNPAAPAHTETVAAAAVTNAPAPLAHPQVQPALPPCAW